MEAFVEEHGAKLVIAIAAAAAAFLLKLGRDFVVDKSRQAASVRIVAVYIRRAVEGWDHPDIQPDESNPKKRRRIVKLRIHIRNTLRAARGPGGEPFTSFIPFSPHDNLTVAEVRDFLGFLDSRTIDAVVKFVQSEAITHALAEDFRSEYVRRQFDARRKARLLFIFNRRVVAAYDAGQEARNALEPLCPRALWWLPLGYRLWRGGCDAGGSAAAAARFKRGEECRVRACRDLSSRFHAKCGPSGQRRQGHAGAGPGSGAAA